MAVSGFSSAAGLSGSPTVQSAPQVTTGADGGKRYTYTLVVQVPIPFVGFNFDLRSFILPVLTKLGIPKAVEWFTTHADQLLQNIVDDVAWLVRTIPEASVFILVKVGPAVVLNIQLVAEKVPVEIPLPAFALDLPNLAVDFALTIPFPAPPPILVSVPIPVPILPSSLKSLVPTVTGGNVTAGAGVGVQPVPLPIQSPISLPGI